MTGRAKSGPLKGMNPTVTLTSAALVLTLMVLGAMFTDRFAGVLETVRGFLTPFFRWYYVVVVTFLLAFVLWLGLSRYRNVRLGGDEERPEFRTLSWLAMLFAAGTGVGLVFWSIAEPIRHYQGNPFVEGSASPEAAITALRLTYFHWGLSGWAIFSTVALIFGYFGFRRRLPLTVSSALHPLIGNRIHGWAGHLVDVLAVFGTVFGVATTLGLGVQQINTGLDRLLGWEVSTTHQLIIIATVTVIATASTLSGARRGVRLLSEINVWLSVVIMAFFLFAGPTNYLLSLLVESVGDYLQNLLQLSFFTGTRRAADWQQEWTVFYWGWWIAWAPFVGMFIARISRGRTVREFLMGVLLVPTLISFIWIALFGGTALHMELYGGGGIVQAVEQDVTLALYRTIEQVEVVPWLRTAAAGVATLLIAFYFITSADSGTLVVNIILSKGDTNPPKRHRAVWGIGIGVLTGVLLVAGGVEALQTAVILAALPFSLVMLAMVSGLMRALQDEVAAPRKGQKQRRSREPWTGSDEPSG